MDKLIKSIFGACFLIFPLPATSAADIENSVRGIVTPIREAMISVDMSRRVSKIYVREGAKVEAGEPLLSFDCSEQHAELDALKAKARAALLDWKNKRELLAYKATGTNDVKFAEAKFAEARAEVEVLDRKLLKCNLLAPFSGRVAKVSVNIAETPPSNTSLLHMISDRELELDMVVPAVWLSWLEIGTNFRFVLDENGGSHPADVIRIGVAVDPVNQTIRVTGQLKQPDEGILSGMSGTATFRQPGS